MAKAKEVKRFEFSKVGTILDNMQKLFRFNRKEIKERKFISTGVYILRCISKDVGWWYINE
jgi:hypothetical protein